MKPCSCQFQASEARGLDMAFKFRRHAIKRLAFCRLAMADRAMSTLIDALADTPSCDGDLRR